jgi:NAD-dependent dihydropyrimidine dehydrogenase PreA subunit
MVTGPKFAIDAIAAGKEAAVSIHRYVHPGQTLNIGRDHRDYKPLDVKSAAISIESFDAPARQRAAAPAPEKAKKTFRDLRGGLTEEQMKKETERCLGCGAVVVNENMCVGCGVCTTKCRFDAIHLEKVREQKGTPYYKTLGRAAGYAGKRYGKLVAKTISKSLAKKED